MRGPFIWCGRRSRTARRGLPVAGSGSRSPVLAGCGAAGAGERRAGCQLWRCLTVKLALSGRGQPGANRLAVALATLSFVAA
jgi:hypothetical protein